MGTMMARSEIVLKKPSSSNETTSQPRTVQRADVAPMTGFTIVVDGHYKTEFAEEVAASTAARALLVKFPMLKVEIFDARSKARVQVR
jgi:hypothetical protein